MIYDRTIAVHRARTAAGSATPIGLTGYSGEQQTTDPTNPAGEAVLYTGVPASVQVGTTGRKKDGALPTDAVWAPTWRIYLRKGALPKDTIRDRDIIVDDQGYRYQVAQCRWTAIGYQIICIRLEA